MAMSFPPMVRATGWGFEFLFRRCARDCSELRRRHLFSCTDGIDLVGISGSRTMPAQANINVNCMNGNKTASIFLNSVNKTVLDDFDSDGSTGSCIILKNSNQNTFEDFDASGCGVNGITATGSNRNTFSGFSADGNTGDGVNFKNSGRNALTGVEIDGNGGNGVTFKNSSRNSLTGVFGAHSASPNNGGDGVFIDPSSNDKVADLGFDGTGGWNRSQRGQWNRGSRGQQGGFRDLQSRHWQFGHRPSGRQCRMRQWQECLGKQLLRHFEPVVLHSAEPRLPLSDLDWIAASHSHRT